MLLKKFVIGPLDTNCYLLGSPEVIVLIDPGFETKKIINEIEKINPAKLIVLLTHGHFEHSLHVDRIKEHFPDMTLMYHEAEYNPKQEKATPEIIKYMVHTIEEYKAGKLKKGQEEYEKVFECLKRYGLFANVKADKWIKDGTEIQLDEITLTTLETPGHSPGSLSFYSNEIKEIRGHLVDGVIFTGDFLLKRNVGEFKIPGGNEKLLFSNIKSKIMENPDLNDHFKILGGHYADSTIAEERILNPFKDRF